MQVVAVSGPDADAPGLIVAINKHKALKLWDNGRT